jgi:hypothetical protein
MDIANNAQDLQPTQTSIQWEPEALLPKIKRLVRETKAEVEDECLHSLHPLMMCARAFTNHRSPGYSNFQ